MAKGVWAHFKVLAQHSHPKQPHSPLLPWELHSAMVWVQRSHLSTFTRFPNCVLQKDKTQTAEAQGTQTSAIRALNHYLRQDSQTPAPEGLLLAHTGEGKSRIPDKGWRSCEPSSSHWADSASTAPGWRTGQWLMHGITSQHQVPVLPELGTELIFRTRLFLKDKATGSWSAHSEVPEFRPAMGTHFCKHCSAYTDCFGKPQQSFLCTIKNLPNDTYCVSLRGSTDCSTHYATLFQGAVTALCTAEAWSMFMGPIKLHSLEEGNAEILDSTTVHICPSQWT